MTHSGGPVLDAVTITRLGEGDWRSWREVRLAALAESPAAFGALLEVERTLVEDDWRELVRNAAVFVAVAGDGTAGAVAGLYRDSGEERGLGAMWVVPRWRGRGVAGMLVGAVTAWSRSEHAVRLGLWAPEDNARARRFYERQGFRMTGKRRSFPGDPGRSIIEMSLALAES